MINRMRTLTVSRLYRRHFVARPAGTELSSNILVNSYLELERLQQTARKDCKRRSDELWHAFFASLYADFYAAGERLQPGSVAEPNDFVALRRAARRIGSFWGNRTFRQEVE